MDRAFNTWLLVVFLRARVAKEGAPVRAYSGMRTAFAHSFPLLPPALSPTRPRKLLASLAILQATTTASPITHAAGRCFAVKRPLASLPDLSPVTIRSERAYVRRVLSTSPTNSQHRNPTTVLNQDYTEAPLPHTSPTRPYSL